jgi:hypothetical protein
MEPRTVETEFKGEKVIIIIRNLLDHDDPVLNLEILIDLRSLFIDCLDKRVEGGLTGCSVWWHERGLLQIYWKGHDSVVASFVVLKTTNIVDVKREMK